ncbi:hypothetical protein ATN79_20520 [Paraburkholderia caribensis]|nr:hypothetical protein ATN79_20520 [Paraburkholderia caribensis]
MSNFRRPRKMLANEGSPFLKIVRLAKVNEMILDGFPTNQQHIAVLQLNYAMQFGAATAFGSGKKR